MEKFLKGIGKACLAVAALIVVFGPASMSSMAVEEMPESMKDKR
ncbi:MULTISPECIES: hypothetical protein [Clostridium]|nr:MULTISPECIES: hypothetical protein [Clostridium]MDD7795964.1 hypothetical protein [Clostridium sp. 'White wine YQ']